MKIELFKYKKEETEEKEYKVLILENNDKYLSGINLEYLNNEEIAEIKKIQLKYEEDLKPFMKKAYRRFIKEKIV